jgi:hypothetical protein
VITAIPSNCIGALFGPVGHVSHYFSIDTVTLELKSSCHPHGTREIRSPIVVS